MTTFQQTTYETFSAFYIAWRRDASPVAKDSTVDHARLNSAARYFVSADHLSGFCIDDGELRAVWSFVKGRGDALVSEAVFFGADRLDCFDGYLPTLYARHGFVETHRVANWTPSEPDVVYMLHESAFPDSVQA